MRASKQPIDGEHVEAGRRLALDPTTQSSFANVYRRHKWGGVGGGSGQGSTLGFTGMRGARNTNRHTTHQRSTSS
jgi:hypothetical protein